VGDTNRFVRWSTKGGQSGAAATLTPSQGKLTEKVRKTEKFMDFRIEK